jgi:ABC-type sugar transport system permease subunit
MSELVIERAAPPQVATSRLERQVKLFPWILFAPTILYLLLLTVFPLIYSLYISLFRVPAQRDAAWVWVGLENYRLILANPEFWHATLITLLITFIAVGLEVVLGIGVALIFNQRLAGMGLFRLLVYLPMMLSPLVMGFFWKFMLDGTFGVVNWLIEAFMTGIPGATFTLGSLLRLLAILAFVPLAVHVIYWRRMQGRPNFNAQAAQRRLLAIVGVILVLGTLSFILPEITIHVFENGLMGTLNPIIRALGGEPYFFEPIQWTIEPNLAVASIILVDVWQWTPFVALLATAGLQTVPQQLYEAATLDRASRWMQFRRITLPFLVTPVLVAVLFRSIDTIKIFDTVWLLTGGGPGDFTQTWSVMVYKYGFVFNDKRGEAAALSWIMVIFINILVTVLLQLVARSRSRSRMAPAAE